ncbi:hypothetical protein ACFQZC_04455 [Streptacidiphilus monticola]
MQYIAATSFRDALVPPCAYPARGRRSPVEQRGGGPGRRRLRQQAGQREQPVAEQEAGLICANATTTWAGASST